MSNTVVWEDKGVYIEYSNSVSVAEILQVDGSIYGDSRFDKFKYTIVNFLNVKNIDVTKKDVNVISTIDINASRWNFAMKVAIVATDLKAVTLIKEYTKQIQSTDWEIRILDSMEEARRWVEE